jgi:hypothetical protein
MRPYTPLYRAKLQRRITGNNLIFHGEGSEEWHNSAHKGNFHGYQD